jgi:hypothetical protein
MLFVVGTAMAPTVENSGVVIGTVELRQPLQAEDDTVLLPWPEDFCISPCPDPPTEPSLTDLSWKPVLTTTTAPPAPPLTAPRVVAPPPAPRPVEEWRSLVSAYFAPSDVETALRVISCESGGDPNAVNPSSGAAGLFQHIPRYWPDRAAAIGLPGASIFDPVANVAAAAWLVSTEGWTPWNASAACW